MQRVKNTSSERQAIANMPAFEAGEERGVCDADAQILLGNENFVLLEQKNVYPKSEDTQKKQKSK